MTKKQLEEKIEELEKQNYNLERRNMYSLFTGFPEDGYNWPNIKTDVYLPGCKNLKE